MWSAQFDIIVETLTGSEFEVTVTDQDTIFFIKSQIQKHEGKCLPPTPHSSSYLC